MFNWDDLRPFIEVIRTGSLSGAAGKLRVNQSTVARRIEALEKALAARLFSKTPRGYVLTDAGSQLFRIAERIEADAISVQEVVAGKNPALSGAVRVSVSESFGSQLLARYIPEFYKQYPDVDLEIVALHQFLSISNREADVAITSERPQSGRLVTRKLTNFTCRFYASRDYLNRMPPIRRVEDLKDHFLISNIEDILPTPPLRYLDSILPGARIRLRTKSLNTQIGAVEAGAGLCMLPCFVTAHRPSFVRVLPDDLKVTLSWWISIHQDMRLVRRVIAVRDWILEIVSANQSLLLDR